MKYFFICLLSVLFTQNTYGQFYEGFPLILSSPFDMDTIETQEPTFMWQCDMATILNDPRLSLQFVLSPMEDGQSKSEAILINQPIYILSNVLNSSLYFPSTIDKLERGKTYAWQIQLLFNGMAIQFSEPWQFTIDLPAVLPTNYFILRKHQDASFYSINKPELRLKIVNTSVIKNFSGMIRNDDNEVFPITLEFVNQEEDLLQTIKSSNYYFKVDFSTLKLAEGNYIFEWRHEKTNYFLNFIYKK